MDPSRVPFRSFSRRQALATVAGASGMALAGCLDVLAERADRDLPIRTVAVESDQDGEFYHPSPQNIENRNYSPLTRPLFVFVSHERLAAKPDLIGSFLPFFFEGQHDFARETGYYATADDVRSQNQDDFQAVLADQGIEPDDGNLGGEIVCSGSNTVAPITRAAGEDFENKHRDVLVAVEPEGTGAGFAEFAKGNSDIQNASREILEDEATEADSNGIEYSRYEIGWDGIAVVAHEENDWFETVTLDELAAIWDYDSDITHWNDIREEYPDEKIKLWGRDNASGTFDYFTETITGEVGRIRTDYSPHTDTGSIMGGVGHNKHALGWGSVGYYVELKEEPFGHV